jgi:Protein of unknown function (DUF2949)
VLVLSKSPIGRLSYLSTFLGKGQDLGLSEAALALVSRQHQPTVTELPIVLWNHGLISLEQLGCIFDWMGN